MAILRRNLLSELEKIPIDLNITACFVPPAPGCDPLIDDCLCHYFFPLPPPPPPIRHNSAQTHVVPYLLSGACALGVAVLILTACTILLRHRWTRWRSSRRLGDSTSELVFVDEDQHHPGPIDHPIWFISTVGLQQSVIDEITAFKYRKCDKLIEGTNCSVCLAEFEDGDDLRLLPKCSHAFHLNCIDTWLRSHKNCPLCRSPVVVDSPPAVNLGVVSPNSAGQVSSGLSSEGSSSENLGGPVSTSINISQVGQGESSGERERADDFGRLPIDGVRIEEILKKNRQNRGMSDLGDNYRTMMSSNDGPLPLVRRSVSLDAKAATAMSNSIVVSVPSLTGEGSSRQGKKMKSTSTRWHGNSTTSSSLRKSSSIGCSLQKASVSMKRSSSSSGKIFSSFRGSKSQSSILPL